MQYQSGLPAECGSALNFISFPGLGHLPTSKCGCV